MYKIELFKFYFIIGLLLSALSRYKVTSNSFSIFLCNIILFYAFLVLVVQLYLVVSYIAYRML